MRMYAIPVQLAHTGNKRKFIRTHDDTTFTLDTGKNVGVFDGIRIRSLTPVETERLQGFPDNWTKYGKDGDLISDNQRYRCTGNAITVNVVDWICNNINRYFSNKEETTTHDN